MHSRPALWGGVSPRKEFPLPSLSFPNCQRQDWHWGPPELLLSFIRYQMKGKFGYNKAIVDNDYGINVSDDLE